MHPKIKCANFVIVDDGVAMCHRRLMLFVCVCVCFFSFSNLHLVLMDLCYLTLPGVFNLRECSEGFLLFFKDLHHAILANLLMVDDGIAMCSRHLMCVFLFCFLTVICTSMELCYLTLQSF